MAFITNNPKILITALAGGIIPSLLWLWFWLKEEENPEPKLLITFVFIMGMIATLAVLPAEKYVLNNIKSSTAQIIIWASLEEIFKYTAVLLIIYKTNRVKEPIDWPIFMITAGLGFAALENTLYLLKPLSASSATLPLLAATSLGQLRFLGANLLHAISSGIIGIALGLSFFMGKYAKRFFLLIGMILAISLHSVFNFFIMNSGSSFLQVFAFLWVVTVIVILIFEKIRRMSEVIIN